MNANDLKQGTHLNYLGVRFVSEQCLLCTSKPGPLRSMWLGQPRTALTRRQWCSPSRVFFAKDFQVAQQGAATFCRQQHQQRHQCSKIVSQLRGASSSSAIGTAHGGCIRIRCPLARRSLGSSASSAAGRESSRWLVARGRRHRSSKAAEEGAAAGQGEQRAAKELEKDGAALMRRMARYIEEDPGAADKLGKAVSPSSAIVLSGKMPACTLHLLFPPLCSVEVPLLEWKSAVFCHRWTLQYSIAVESNNTLRDLNQLYTPSFDLHVD